MIVWKAAIIFFFLAGHLTYSHVFQTGLTFDFAFNSVMLSGSPEINSQSATIGLKCKVKVVSLTSKQLVVQITEVKVGKGNKKYDKRSPDEIEMDYRDLAEYTSNLTKPFAINFNSDGLIDNLECAKDDLEWSANFKISLASFFQIKKVSVFSQLKTNNAAPKKQQKTGTVLETIEPTFAGNCKTIYDYRLKRSINSKPGEMRIIKTRDYRTCIENPYFGTFSHRAFKCHSCNKDSSHPLSRNTVCKYKAEINDEENYLIKNAVCDGIVRFVPFGQKADSLTVFHNQTLSLLQVKNVKEKISLASNTKIVKPFSNLLDKLTTIRETTDLTIPIIHNQIFGNNSYLNTAHDLLKKTADLLVNNPISKNYQKITALISNIRFTLSTLSYSELVKLALMFHEISSLQDRTVRKLFYETAALTATGPCITLILDFSLDTLIKPIDIVDLLPTIANNIANPSLAITDQFMQYCQSQYVKRHAQLYITCVINFGNIVAKTCADGAYQLPAVPGNRYCPLNKLKHYIMTIENEIENSNSVEITIALITSLGNMAVKEVIPVLKKYAKNNDGIESQVVQTRAILSLIPVVKQDPELLEKFLVALLFDDCEDTQVRISAFKVLVVSHPSPDVYESLAILSMYEKDKTVKLYVYNTLREIANSTHSCLIEDSGHAKSALNLIDKNHNLNAWIASNYIVEGKTNLEIQSLINLMVFGESGSLTPSSFTLTLENLLSDYATNILKVGFYGRNVNHLIDRLLGSSALFSGKTLMDRISELDDPLPNLAFQKLSELIGYKKSKDPTFEAYFFTRFGNFQGNQFRFDTNNLVPDFFKSDFYKSDNLITVKNPDGFDAQYNNFGRTVMPHYICLSLPIDAGFNVNLEVKSLLLTQFDFHINYKFEEKQNQTDYVIHFALQTHIAMDANAQIGVLIPVENQLFAVGYNTHLTVNPLIGGKIIAFGYSDGFDILLVPQPNFNIQDRTMAHLQTRPFTLIKNIFEFESPIDEGQIIHAKKPKSFNAIILERVIGIVVNTEDYNENESDNDYQKENSLLDKLKLNPEKFRFREYRVDRQKNVLPQFIYKTKWMYTPAISQPEKRYRNLWYLLWKIIAGWSDIPTDCQYGQQIWPKHTFKSSGNNKQEHNPHTTSFFEDGPVYRNSTVSKKDIDVDDDVLVEKVKIGNGVSEFKLTSYFVFGHFGHMRAFSSDLSVTKYHSSFKTAFNFSFSSIGLYNNKTIYLVGETVRSKPSCSFGGQIPNFKYATITSDLKLIYEINKTKPEMTVDIRGIVKKSNEQLQSNLNSLFRYKCGLDRLNGQVTSTACTQGELEESRLNHIEYTFKYDNLPRNVSNLIKKLLQHLMVKLYPYMSHNYNVKNPLNQVKISANFHQNISVMDLQIQQPYETHQFNKIYFGNYAPFVEAPSITQSKTQQLLNYWSGNALTPTCSFGDNYTSNFKDITFNFTLPIGCEYLFSGDCTSANKFAISLLRESQTNKTLIVRLLKNMIEINSNRANDVIINNRSYSMNDRSQLMITDKSTEPKLIAIIVKDSARYKVIMTFIRLSVHFDGEHAQLTTSNIWHNPLCGICGQYNALNEDLFLGPNKFQYTTGDDFARSYSLPRKTCKAPSKNPDSYGWDLFKNAPKSP